MTDIDTKLLDTLEMRLMSFRVDTDEAQSLADRLGVSERCQYESGR